MSDDHRTTIVIITSDDVFAQRATDTLFPQYQVIRGQASVEEAQRLLASCEPDVCIVDVDDSAWNREPDMRLVAAIRAHLENLPIILATGDLSAMTLVPAMRAGANDVCDKEFPPDELLAQIDRSVNRQRARLGSKSASFFTFLGAREGIGTTTTAVAVAEAMAIRLPDDQRVLILDFSHPPAEIPDLVGERPTYFMTDAIHDLSRLDETMIDGALLHAWYPNLCILPLASTERGISRISLDDLVKLIAVLKTYFQVVIADTNWCWRAELAARLFLAADEALLCTSQSIISIHGATAFLEQVRETNGSDFEYRTVLTRYDPALAPSIPQIQKALNGKGAPITIPEDRRHVELSRNAGEPLIRHSRKEFAKAVSHLADELVRPEAGDRTAPRRRRGGFLGRWSRTRTNRAAAAE